MLIVSEKVWYKRHRNYCILRQYLYFAGATLAGLSVHSSFYERFEILKFMICCTSACI
jgi:hypothetical protein